MDMTFLNSEPLEIYKPYSWAYIAKYQSTQGPVVFKSTERLAQEEITAHTRLEHTGLVVPALASGSVSSLTPPSDLFYKPLRDALASNRLFLVTPFCEDPDSSDATCSRVDTFIEETRRILRSHSVFWEACYSHVKVYKNRLVAIDLEGAY